MNTTTAPGPIMEALGSITYHAIKIKPLLPTYIHLLISSVFPIYAAAHASLRRPVSAAPAKRRKQSGKDHRHEESDDNESSSAIESLTMSDAVLFPILAGFTLTGLYLLIKWLEDPKLLNQILGYYFSWAGIFFSFRFVRDVLYFIRSWVFPTQFSWKGRLYKYDDESNCFTAVQHDDCKDTMDEKKPLEKVQAAQSSWFHKSYMQIRQKIFHEVICTATVRKPYTPIRLAISATWLDLLASASAIFIAFHSTLGVKTPWYLTNLQGFAFCYGSFQLMSPGTSAVASLLLALLFFYDIYMVFYTPMMVTVATKLDVPIKLLFPKNVKGVKAMAMLGLGDIVVPGILIAFALRFDLYRYYAKLGKTQKNKTSNGVDDMHGKKETRPIYSSARGSWAERTYTARHLWSPALQAKDFPKPYFKATIVGYILGMISTVLVMTVFDHAQPALLYLVPGVLMTFWGTALAKGEVKLAWEFDEAKEEKEAENKREEKRKAEEEVNKDGKSDKKTKKLEKSIEEKEVENGLKPFLSFNLYFPRRQSSVSSENLESSQVNKQKQTPPELSSKPSQDRDFSATTKEPKLEDAETESESSTNSSTTSSAEIVSQEEALEAEDGADDVEKAEEPTDVAAVVSTRDDEGGAQAVKRRRRG